MNNSIRKQSNTQYTANLTGLDNMPSSTNENYWFQDLAGTIFNLDMAIKIIPNSDMTYAEKINALVRLSIYIGVILALFYANFLFLYIPILTMLGTYVLYLFRLDALDKTRQAIGPNATLGQISNKAMNSLMKQNMSGMGGVGETFEDILNIRRCVRPSGENPFMNPLVFDSRLRDAACDAVKPENQLRIEKEYNRHCIKDISDIWNHNSGRRQFYTVASTTYPHDQGAFANWLYKVPPTCKEGSGAQCVANVPSRINGSLITPSFAQ
jgi:Family of unknown function (DUF5762)